MYSKRDLIRTSSLIPEYIGQVAKGMSTCNFATFNRKFFSVAYGGVLRAYFPVSKISKNVFYQAESTTLELGGEHLSIELDVFSISGTNR